MTPGAGCTWTPLADGSALRVEIRDPSDAGAGRSSATEGAVDAEWSRLCAHNPRCFNGSILAVERADASGNLIVARREEYKRLAVRPVVDTGVTQLGVTGVLESVDAAGRLHVLLGRRSARTRIYGGMWELGPSGGVEAPPVRRGEIDAQSLWLALLGEIREEVGLPVGPDPLPALGLVHDPGGGSVDAVFRVRLVPPMEELTTDARADPGRWEYDEVRWVGVDALPGFVASEPVIGATRTICRAFGWTR